MLAGALQPAATTITVFPNIAALGVTVSGTEGTEVSGIVATFSDPDPNGQASDYTATVDWGDGSPPTEGTGITKDAEGTFAVTAAHSYTEEGSYIPTVAISD